VDAALAIIFISPYDPSAHFSMYTNAPMSEYRSGPPSFEARSLRLLAPQDDGLAL